MAKNKKKDTKLLIVFIMLKTNQILKKNYSSFDLIFANNVFAHIDDLKSVFNIISKYNAQ